MKLDAGLVCEWQSLAQNANDCIAVLLILNRRSIHKRKDNTIYFEFGCRVHQLEEAIQSGGRLLGCASKEWEIHEVIGTHGTQQDTGFLNQALQMRNAV